MEGGLFFDTPFEKAFKEWKKAHKEVQKESQKRDYRMVSTGEYQETILLRKAFLDKVVAKENNPNKKSGKNWIDQLIKIINNYKKNPRLSTRQNEIKQREREATIKTLLEAKKNNKWPEYPKGLKIADLFLKQVGKKDQYRYIQESGGGSGEKGIVTILQEVAKQKTKT